MSDAVIDKFIPLFHREFLSRASDGRSHRDGGDHKDADRQEPEDSFYMDSLRRWLHVLRVWRKVIHQDILLLVLLFHSGSIWSCDYDALWRARTRLCAARVADGDDGLGVLKQKKQPPVKVEAAADAPEEAEGDGEAPAQASGAKRRYRRRAKRTYYSQGSHPGSPGGGPPQTAAGARARDERAEHTNVFLQLFQQYESDVFALNVLHFLHLVELFEVSDRAATDPSTSHNPPASFSADPTTSSTSTWRTNTAAPTVGVRGKAMAVRNRHGRGKEAESGRPRRRKGEGGGSAVTPHRGAASATATPLCSLHPRTRRARQRPRRRRRAVCSSSPRCSCRPHSPRFAPLPGGR
ncbi:hypothetical protein STCU_10806 [Strigomonas culicis]|uniref:Uncharacterized protein n=1 Tax=Strigomonas culicis TaxID=28005 RepID=S9V2X1_9TRYP|nr:hypothetical protein STCU_10806 [Strigomonas culicis]|eukprot:EPY17135.1 hypothetical protein STCU_10806 [Strigomonas culicis]